MPHAVNSSRRDIWRGLERACGGLTGCRRGGDGSHCLRMGACGLAGVSL